MKRKIFYRYNELNDTYERVYPSRASRIWTIVKNVFEGITIAIIIFVSLYYLIDFPRERVLRQENQKLRNEISDLDGQLSEALTIMDEIAKRDNNFYRVMLQADPLSMSQRASGHEQAMAMKKMDDAELVSSVNNKMDLLNRLIYSQIGSFNELRTMASQQSARIAAIPSIQPISNSDLRQMASGYGRRVDPVYGTMKFHEGMDFSSPVGTKVYATGDGVVSSAGWKSAYGNMIEINHGFDYTTRFAHLSEILVKPGQKVSRGDLIGKVGNTGKSTGPHLHYEVRYKGQPRNPINYYFQDLTPEQYAEMVRESESAAHVMD